MVVKNEVRLARQKKTAEVFTPNSLVNEMLDALPKTVWQSGKTFLDPAAGNGQFLVWIVIRKIQKGQTPLQALKTTYGVDLMRDNIQECRARLLKVVQVFEPITTEHVDAVVLNVVRANSLTYHFNFRKPKKETRENAYRTFLAKGALNDVEIPNNLGKAA